MKDEYVIKIINQHQSNICGVCSEKAGESGQLTKE